MTDPTTTPCHPTLATHLAHGSVYRSHGHRPVMARRLGDPPPRRVVRQPIHDEIEARLQEIADDYHRMGIVNSDGEVEIPDDEIEEIKSEFQDYFDENPDLIEEVSGYIDDCARLYELESRPPQRPWLTRRVHVPARRARARRSHRVVRVTKTAAGDSGDPDPEPPGNRRCPSSGAASVEISTEHAPDPAHRSALVDLLADLIGGGR